MDSRRSAPAPATGGLIHVRQDQNHMATTFSLCISCPTHHERAASRALTEAHARVTALEAVLSEFQPKSPVYRLNHVAPFVKVAFTTEGIELLQRSEQIRKLTGGAFDCTAKSVLPGGPALSWDCKTLEAWRLGEGVRLGFGAIGKGYALDQVRLLLESRGFHDYVLSAGGSSLIFSGFAGPGDPWTWGWSWKKNQEGVPLGIALAHPTGQAIAVGVSGMHEKGQHLIDPRPRALAQAPPQSMLIALPSAADADAFSTALFIAGYEQGSRFLRDLPASAAVAQIDAAGVPIWNGIFNQLWGSLSLSATRLALGAALVVAATLPGGTGIARADAAPAAPASVTDDGAVDLGTLGANNTFTPYINERNPGWALLPVFAAALVLIHLKKTRRTPVKAIPPSRTPLSLFLVTLVAWSTLEQAGAAEVEPLGKALLAVLGTPKVSKKTLDGTTVFYSKNAAGKADRVAFIQKNIWQTSCNHTWVVGIGPDGKVTQIRVQDLQCPHAGPVKAASFLEQYKGKGPADLSKLTGEINTLAKATGSCNLATDAVKESVTTYQKIKGQL